MTFEYREIRKRKNNEEFTLCLFYIHISFDRDIGHYVIKRSVSTHEGHVVNQASISDHASYESDLSDDEKNQLAKFGKWVVLLRMRKMVYYVCFRIELMIHL